MSNQDQKLNKALSNASEKQALGETLMLILRDFQRRLDTDLEARGVPGISSRHRAVFLYLGRHGPSRSVDLANAAGIRPQSMMKIVHELEESGLVQRTVDPNDSRAKRISFTEKGETFIDELGISTEKVWDEYADQLGEDQLKQILSALKSLL
jgi:MarR family transcriptional regulator for hemolysin